MWGLGRFEGERACHLDWNLAAALLSVLPSSDPGCLHLQPGTALPGPCFQMVWSSVAATGKPDGFLVWGWGVKEEGRYVLVCREYTRVCV